tara:strand:- start:5560 stop:6351 length:792 start_codon:yes stop_codon:yes gene_type:complete
LLQAGHTDVVLDNTYRDVESRAGIIAVCQQHGVDCECVWLDTSIEDAQVNACTRMYERHGSVLTPEQIKESDDPNVFPIAALYSYRKGFEKPTMAEGFSSIERVKFERRERKGYTNKALLLDYDGTLRVSSGPKVWPEHPDHVEVMPGRTNKLRQYSDEGYLLLGASNQSAIAKGLSIQVVIDCFEKTNELLGVEIPYLFCPHRVPPISCYCRKPGPGMGVHFIERYKLDPSRCIMVGDSTSDKTFAARCGFQYQDQAKFFTQ